MFGIAFHYLSETFQFQGVMLPGVFDILESRPVIARSWTLQVVLENCPFSPAVRTHCQVLITAASAGTTSATHHSRPLARIWNRVAHSVGDDWDDISALVTSGELVRVLAHLSHTAIGETKKGDVTRLTAAFWRTNRLVDALNRAAAPHLQTPRDTTSLVVSLEAAAAHAACFLRVVTRHANNYHPTRPVDGGGVAPKVLRDRRDKRQPVGAGRALFGANRTHSHPLRED